MINTVMLRDSEASSNPLRRDGALIANPGGYRITRFRLGR